MLDCPSVFHICSSNSFVCPGCSWLLTKNEKSTFCQVGNPKWFFAHLRYDFGLSIVCTSNTFIFQFSMCPSSCCLFGVRPPGVHSSHFRSLGDRPPWVICVHPPNVCPPGVSSPYVRPPRVCPPGRRHSDVRLRSVFQVFVLHLLFRCSSSMHLSFRSPSFS